MDWLIPHWKLWTENYEFDQKSIKCLTQPGNNQVMQSSTSMKSMMPAQARFQCAGSLYRVPRAASPASPSCPSSYEDSSGLTSSRRNTDPCRVLLALLRTLRVQALALAPGPAADTTRLLFWLRQNSWQATWVSSHMDCPLFRVRVLTVVWENISIILEDPAHFSYQKESYMYSRSRHVCGLL